ncbi:MAG: hypothetical protein O2800_01485 [Planctomycetota bacterium]|nr:hypothetical protein [Planctomycetota bacterium]
MNTRVYVLLAWCCVTVAAAQQGTNTTTPPPPNAADHYARASAMAAKDGTGLLSEEDWYAVYDFGMSGAAQRTDPALRIRVQRALDRAAPILAAINDAAAIPSCNWNLDLTLGFGLPLPHLSQQRELARLLNAQYAAALDDGDVASACTSNGLLRGMMAHTGSDGVTISSLVGSAMGTMCVRQVDGMIESGLLTPEQAATLSGAYTPISLGDPLGFIEAAKSEALMLEVHLKDTSAIPILVASNEDRAKIAALLEEEQATADLEQLRKWHGDFSKAMESDDRATAMALVEVIDAEVLESNNTIAQTLFPSITRIALTRFDVQEQFAARAAILTQIAQGETTSASLANAAYWYARAGAATSALDPMIQSIATMILAAPDAATTKQRQLVRDVYERRRSIIDESLSRASQCGKCDYQVRPGNLDAPSMAAVRGALRFMMVDALAACAAESPTLSKTQRSALMTSALVRSIRGWRHIVSDSLVTHALVASTLQDDIASTLTTALAASVLTTEDLALLRVEFEMIAASNPFGFEASREAEARNFFDIKMPSQADPAIKEARLAAARTLSLNELYFLRAAWSPELADAPQGEDLVRWDDLVPSGSIASVIAVRDCIESTPLNADTAEAIRAVPALGSCERVTVIDCDGARDRAMVRFSALTELIERAVATVHPPTEPPSITE